MNLQFVKPGKREAGFTLVEVMIAMAIFAVGFLAVAAMQINAVNKTTNARKVTKAIELASREVEHIRNIPFYDEDVDLDGNGTVEKFDILPDLAVGQHTMNDAWTGLYTIRWTVVDDSPIAAIPNIYTPPPPNNVTISKTITITVAPDADAADILARMEMVKVWEQDI
ncbi:MAG: prepilin-type N-terminal cleavage/methylation domain-containing protein [Deltaproteobacteria bacterium]|nr:prepilin-type N-terminal cleavage/methylation domain-containing protein [Deltaproteobacteria bacterium]